MKKHGPIMQAQPVVPFLKNIWSRTILCQEWKEIEQGSSHNLLIHLLKMSIFCGCKFLIIMALYVAFRLAFFELILTKGVSSKEKS